MAYEVKPGQGTLNQNKAPGRTEKSPGFKGYMILPDGSVLGLAQWKVTTSNGVLLSLKVDDREGAYWAKKLNREQTLGEERRDDRDNTARRAPRPDEDRQRYRQDNAGRSRHDAPRQSERRSRHAEVQHTDDLDDEIPF